MKIQKLVQVKGVFAPFVRTRLSPKLSYKLLKFLKAIEFEEKFFNSKVKELLNEFGQKNKQGKYITENGNIKIIEGKEEACANAFNELNDLEVSVPDITFTLEELKDITLSVQDIAIIEDFIKEE